MIYLVNNIGKYLHLDVCGYCVSEWVSVALIHKSDETSRRLENILIIIFYDACGINSNSNS